MRVLDPPPIGSGKEWRFDAVKLEHLFRRSVVLGEEMRMWAAACVWHIQQVHIGGHVHFLGVIACKRLGEIEYYVGVALCQRSQALPTTVQHLIERFMTQFLEGLENFLAIFLFNAWLACSFWL